MTQNGTCLKLRSLKNKNFNVYIETDFWQSMDIERFLYGHNKTKKRIRRPTSR